MFCYLKIGLPIFNIFCNILSLPLSGCFIVQLLMYLVLLQFFKLFNNEKVFNISFTFVQFTYWNAQLIVTVIYRMLHHKLKWRDMVNSELGQLGHGGSSWSNDGFRSITSLRRFLLTTVNPGVNKFAFNGTEWKKILSDAIRCFTVSLAISITALDVSRKCCSCLSSLFRKWLFKFMC